MKNILQIAKQIIASSVENLPAIKTDFSEILDQLPPKDGLSREVQGKS